MNSYKRIGQALFIFFLFSFQFAWAEEGRSSENYWQCTTTDGEEKAWVAQGAYELSAINQAFAACKKASALPRTCKSSKHTCEFFVNWQTTKPMWRCVALDRMANQWPSNIYFVRDDAALAAKAFCKDRSPIPASCYINLLTCQNINAENALEQ